MLLHHRWGGMCRLETVAGALSDWSQAFSWVEFVVNRWHLNQEENLFVNLDRVNRAQMFAQLYLSLAIASQDAFQNICTKTELCREIALKDFKLFEIVFSEYEYDNDVFVVLSCRQAPFPIRFFCIWKIGSLQISIATVLCIAFLASQPHLHQEIYAHCTILAKFIAAHNCDIRHAFKDSLFTKVEGGKSDIQYSSPPYLIDPLMKPYFTLYAASV